MHAKQRIRARALQHARHWIDRRGLARIEMSVMVTLSGATALGVSTCLRWLGMNTMALRYPLAVLGGYLVFLALLGLWLSRRKGETVSDAIKEYAQTQTDLLPDSGAESVEWLRGGGGQFGGGGASGDWGEPVSAAMTGSDTTSAITGVPDLDDDLGVVIAVIAAALAAIVAVFASLYMVYAAPELLTEVLADVLVSATVYGRLRRYNEATWLYTAVRGSAVAALATALSFACIGWAADVIAPDANTLGQAIAAWRANTD